MHHLGDQLGAVEAGPVVGIRHSLGEDAGAELPQRPVRQLDRFQAARTQLAADGTAEVDLHFSTLGVVLRRGHNPTISITMPSTGSNGRTMPPSSALSQRGRKRRMAGLSDIAGRHACLPRRQRIGRFVFDIEGIVVVGMHVAGDGLTLLPPRRAFRGERAHVEALPE